MILVVRSGSNPLALAEPIRRAIRRLDPAQPVADVRIMGEVIAGTFSRQRFSTLLLIGFSVASLLLAAVGVFGILTYSVSERTREIGVRVAVGATPYGIISLVMTAAATPVFAGLVAGMAGAFALTGLLRSVLFDVSPRDPLTFAVVPLILALVASFAAYLPARRASRLDPMVSLRTE
jgi:putative ABC transport system permease protein